MIGLGSDKKTKIKLKSSTPEWPIGLQAGLREKIKGGGTKVSNCKYAGENDKTFS